MTSAQQSKQLELKSVETYVVGSWYTREQRSVKNEEMNCVRLKSLCCIRVWCELADDDKVTSLELTNIFQEKANIETTS